MKRIWGLRDVLRRALTCDGSASWIWRVTCLVTWWLRTIYMFPCICSAASLHAMWHVTYSLQIFVVNAPKKSRLYKSGNLCRDYTQKHVHQRDRGANLKQMESVLAGTLCSKPSGAPMHIHFGPPRERYKTVILTKCFTAWKGIHQYIFYKFTFLTSDAPNQKCRYKRNRQTSYGPKELYQLDQKSKLVSHSTCLYIHAGAGCGDI